jgi:hypothetical protein
MSPDFFDIYFNFAQRDPQSFERGCCGWDVSGTAGDPLGKIVKLRLESLPSLLILQ